MNAMIFNPVQEFDTKFRHLHLEQTQTYLNALIQRSAVNVEQNRKTVKEYNDCKAHLEKIKKSYRWWCFWRVVMIITILLIPVVILKITPKIKALRSEIELAERNAEQLLALAYSQMQPLNSLFTDCDALRIIEQTIPHISFAPFFSVDQEMDMRINYDFNDYNNAEQSTIDVLAGRYNENPFVFEKRLTHRMGEQVYHGSKIISWREVYRDSQGKMRSRIRTQTLHASVVKPKPYYSTQVVLNYGAQGAPDLVFTRDATHLEQKSEKEIERYVKRGEKKLKKKTDRAIKENKQFVGMANTDFEVLFDALDRTHEVQFRTMFTPLAQTNMVELLRSPVGFGDDFHFIKQKRTNRIISQHSQGRNLLLSPNEYYSYSVDIIWQSFVQKNVSFFKMLYFDFAPLWSIPMYQERPVHSLQQIPDYAQNYSYKESEALFNLLRPENVVHPATKTRAILKSTFVSACGGVDEVCVSAYSYDRIPRVDLISVFGGDGHWHAVPVPWQEYVPLVAHNNFFVANAKEAPEGGIMARRNETCVFKK